MSGIAEFRHALHNVLGPLGYFVMETRVPEKVTVLNWGVIVPPKGERYLFGVVQVGFDHHSSDLWNGAKAQVLARVTNADEQGSPQ